MAHYQTKPAKALDKVDPVWARIRDEAEEITRREPELATFIYENILHQRLAGSGDHPPRQPAARTRRRVRAT